MAFGRLAITINKYFTRTFIPSEFCHTRLWAGKTVKQLVRDTRSQNHLYKLDLKTYDNNLKLVFNPSTIYSPECKFLSRLYHKSIIPTMTVKGNTVYCANDDHMPFSVYSLFLDNSRDYLREMGADRSDSTFSHFCKLYWWNTDNIEIHKDISSTKFIPEFQDAGFVSYMNAIFDYHESLIMKFRVTDQNWHGPEYFYQRGLLPHDGLLRQFDEECAQSYSMAKSNPMEANHEDGGFNLDTQHRTPLSALIEIFNGIDMSYAQYNTTGLNQYCKNIIKSQKQDNSHTYQFLMFYYAMQRAGISVTDLKIHDIVSMRSLP